MSAFDKPGVKAALMRVMTDVPSPEKVRENWRDTIRLGDGCDACFDSYERHFIEAERERCAKIAEAESYGWKCDCGHDHALDVAARIRSSE